MTKVWQGRVISVKWDFCRNAGHSWRRQWTLRKLHQHAARSFWVYEGDEGSLGTDLWLVVDKPHLAAFEPAQLAFNVGHGKT